jgi:hypothetical protein
MMPQLITATRSTRPSLTAGLQRVRPAPGRRGRGLGAPVPAAEVRQPGRAGTGLQLRPARGELERRRVPAGRHRQPLRRTAAGIVQHVGALEPRRGPARHPVRTATRGPRAPGRPGLAAERRYLPETGSRPGPAAGPGRDPADAGPARLGVPVPGRGTRPARGPRHSRGPGPGSGLQPVARRGEGPRRLPCPTALDRRRPVVRVRARRRPPAPAGLVWPAPSSWPAPRPKAASSPPTPPPG